MSRVSLETLHTRDGGVCHYCKCETILPEGIDNPYNDNLATREHIVPRSKGGTWDMFNLVLACRACNGARGNNDHVCDCDFCVAAYRLMWEKKFDDIVRYNTVKIYKSGNRWVLFFRGKTRRYYSWDKAMNACYNNYLGRAQRDKIPNN